MSQCLSRFLKRQVSVTSVTDTVHRVHEDSLNTPEDNAVAGTSAVGPTNSITERESPNIAANNSDAGPSNTADEVQAPEMKKQ